MFLSLYDPYVVQTLQSVSGSSVTVQTTHGSVRGILTNVMPDHIVVENSGTPFFIRIQQIIWVFPTNEA
ncbi:YuzF family protein [Halobacillus campisalis]|uniref:YuzF family protein n=1 Tax=Halobacillus campisalis TaxID=435909 RepID=A0ABW2K7G7_9BACI|nr:YuzF family protein [Halobacillus campisalis]